MRSLARLRILSPPAPWPAQQGFVETAVLAGRDELWVTQMTTGMAHVFRFSDFSHLATFPTGGAWPKVIAVSPDEATVFVSNWESRDVSVIDAASRKTVSRDGRFLYVCLFDRGTVQKVDIQKRSVAKSLSFGEGAMRHVVLHPVRDELYVSDMLKGRILVVDAARDALLAEIRVARNLNTIALSPDGRFLFVCSRGPNNPVVDWTWGRNQPTGLAVSPDGRTVAFSNFLDDEIEVYAFVADD
jgi:6-phosphogluconolactonase (cycloisomerase 2 family)